MNRQVLAREWLWFVGCALVSTVWIFYTQVAPTTDLDSIVPGVLFGLLLGCFVYLAVGAVRLTIWAIRTATR